MAHRESPDKSNPDLWSKSGDAKDLNVLINDNASQFFSTPKLSASTNGRLTVGAAGFLKIPKSGSCSPVVRYKRSSQNVSISSTDLNNESCGSPLQSTTSVPDIATSSPDTSSYLEEFDPLVPEKADSLEELFKGFNQIATKQDESTLVPPKIPPRPPRSPANSISGPPLPPRPEPGVITRAFSEVTDSSYRKVENNINDQPPVPAKRSAPPKAARRTSRSEITSSGTTKSNFGVVCLQPVEKLKSCIDKVQFRSDSFEFSQSNCMAVGFDLSPSTTTSEKQPDNLANIRIKVRYFINDDERSSKEPYLEYKNCKLSQTAQGLLDYWMASYHVVPGNYLVRLSGCQIFLESNSVIGSHLNVRKLVALKRPLDICVKNVDEDIENGKIEKRKQRSKKSMLNHSEAVTWSLAQHLEHLVQLSVEWNVAISSDSEKGKQLSLTDRRVMKFIQSAKLLSSFLNIDYAPLSDAFERLENSTASDLSLYREAVMVEALDLSKYLIASFQYLKHCKELTKMPIMTTATSDNFEVRIFSISNIGSLSIQESLSKISIDLCMYYNSRVIYKSTFRDFWHNVRSKSSVKINQTVTFTDPVDSGVVRICDLPREVVLSVSLFYISESNLAEVKLASVACSVFDCNGVFNDSHSFLPFWVKPNLPHPDFTHLSSPTLNSATSMNTCPILHLQMANPHPDKNPIVFSSVQSEAQIGDYANSDARKVPDSPLRNNRLKRMDRIFQHKHQNILLRNPEIPIPTDERGGMIRDDCDLIWQYRRSLLTDESYGSNCLPDVLLTNVNTWSFAHTCQIPELVALCCGQINKFYAFVILLYRFSDAALRQFAVENLDFTVDELIVLIPVLCECLKYEIYIANALVEFLLEKCAHSLLFGISLFRSFTLCTSTPHYKQMFDVYKAAIAEVCPASVVEWFQAQDQLESELQKFYTDTSYEKDTGVLQSFLAELNETLFQNGHRSIASFFPPGRTCLSFNVTKCFLHAKSNAKPMHLFFTTKSDFELEVIYKFGDDLRQDQLMSLLMTFMNSWWLSDGLDLRFVSYGVFPCTPTTGFIEVVPNAVTLCQLQTISGGFTGALSWNCIYQWLRQKNPDATDFETALDNFSLSTAAYCVATYILGVCDRHNDNVMILNSGHLFHIDYGRIFGHTQKFGPVNRDRTPFILTKDMFYAINRSNSDVSDWYYEFVKTCCQAYNVVRRNADFVIGVVRHMIGGERPEMSREIQFLVQRLQPHLSEDEATQMFTQKINESIDKSIVTSLNFVIHALGQTGLSSARSKRLFDFTLNNVSRHDSSAGEILMVKIAGIQQRFDSDHEKYHVYVCEVTTERRNNYFVFRRWSHFKQLLTLLESRYPDFFKDPKSRLILNIQQILGKQSTRLGYRRNAIQQFLDFIYASNTSSVRNSDAVYTFFQSLPEDKSFTLNDDYYYHSSTSSSNIHSSPSMSSMQSSSQFGGKIDMKVTCDERKSQVKVLVKRCIDLMTSSYSMEVQEDSLNSNVYVKLKLLPVDEKLLMRVDGFKQKTDIKNSSCPIFNQLFTFNIGGNSWENLYLEVSVCYYQFSTVNSSCVGKVNIPLMTLNQQSPLEDTFLLC